MGDKEAGTAATVRLYRSQDLESCRALWVELTQWHREIYESPTIGGPDPGRHFDEHLERVGPEHIWVAELGGRVVGLAGLIPGQGEAELEPIVVSKPHRRLGIGRHLAAAIVAAARARGVHTLKVRPVARNEPAIRFFHEQGFDILGHVELFTDFSTGEPQIWRSGQRLADRDFRV